MVVSHSRHGETGVWVAPFLVVLSSVTAGALLIFSLPWGVGASPDSVTYLRAAQSIATGFGLDRLPSYWTPGYPVYVALLTQVLPPVKQAALYGQSILLALNGCLFALLIFYCLGKNVTGRRWLALGACLFFLTNPSIFLLHQYALSEALFTFFMLAGTLATWWFLRGGGNGRMLIAALLVGCLPLTRFAGIVFVPLLGLLVYLCWQSKSQSRRPLTRSLLFTAISLLPLAIWMWVNLATRGELINRVLSIHPVSCAHLQNLADVFISWFKLPGPQLLSVLAPGALLCSVTWSLVAKKVDSCERRLILTLGLSVPIYVVFIFFVISFIDANIPVDRRILLPAWLALYIAIFLSLREAVRRKPLAIVILVCLLGIGANGIKSTAAGINQSMNYGLGYQTVDALRSELLARTRATPRATLIYSNAQDYIFLHSGREVRSLPRIYRPSTRQLNQNFLAEMAEIVQGVDEGRAVIVFFYGFEFRRYLPTIEQLRDEFSLYSRATYPDGAYLEEWRAP